MTPTDRQQAHDLVRVLAGAVKNLRADGSINAEAKKSLDLTATFLLQEIAAAIAKARREVYIDISQRYAAGAHGIEILTWCHAQLDALTVQADKEPR